MKRKIILILILAVFFSSCTKDFAELNKSKTASTDTKPDGLLTIALHRGSLPNYIYQRAQMLHGNHYMQYYANKASYFNTDIYDPNESWANQIWNRLYSDKSFACLHHISEAVLLAQEQGNKHKEGIARIWRAYLFQLTTDMYGDIPYSEAFKSNTPKYDSQKDIYYDLLNQLKTAQELLAATENFESFGNADIMYDGNIQKWKRFGNSLRLRMAMRISNVDFTKAQEVFAELAVAEFMQGNEDNAKMYWMVNSDNHYNLNPLMVINKFNEFRVSERLISQMINTSDPRLVVYAQPAESDGQYRGLPNGIDPILLAGYDESYFANFSKMGAIFLIPEGPTYNFTYAETCFLLSEASLKGWMPGAAEDFYNQGIQAAMNMYGITNMAEINNYIAQTGIAFDQANALEQIITQKWLALMNNGLESWAEKRRTGFPELNPLQYLGGETGGELPRRIIYASDERLYNYENLQKAIESLPNGDNILSRIWWDVND